MHLFAIIILVVCGAYMLLNFKHDIQMAQQNSYRIDRYWKYLKSDIDSAWRLTDVACLFLLFSTLLTPVLSLSIISVVCLVKIYLILTRKYKKPLAFTQRVKRIYSVTALLGLAPYIAVAICCGFRNDIWGRYPGPVIAVGMLLLFAVFSWAFVIAALWLLTPVENRINRKYWNEADAILKSMPGLTVIGITGSYGKTSTKHYLERILSEKFEVLMTPGSYNTPMGVIRTVRERMKPYDQIFICEMGAKQVGDIKEICDLVHPSIGIITAVGPMHLESFKTMENVQATKFELADALPPDGLAVINNDFEYTANREVPNVEAVRYSVAPGQAAVTDYRASDIEYSAQGTTFTLHGPDGLEMKLHTRLVGSCNISNLIGAVVVALRLGMTEAQIKRAVDHVEQVEHRLSVKTTPGGVTIIDDAFNSNPSGSKMALEVLAGMKPGKRVCVTPGMIELGDRQEELNRELGRNMARCCDTAIVVGQYNREAIDGGLREEGFGQESIHLVDSFAEAQRLLATLLKPGDAVLYENDLPDTFK